MQDKTYKHTKVELKFYIVRWKRTEQPGDYAYLSWNNGMSKLITPVSNCNLELAIPFECQDAAYSATRLHIKEYEAIDDYEIIEGPFDDFGVVVVGIINEKDSKNILNNKRW